MKKCMFVLAFLGLLPAAYANGYEYQDSSSQYIATRSGTKSYKRTNTVRKVGGYHNTITNNFYYGQPPAQQAPVEKPVYRDYEEVVEQEYIQPVAKTEYKEEKTVEYKTQERKYFLAHPFFQPLKGSFGSVTDVSYARNSFKFDIQNANILDIDKNSLTYGDIVRGLADGSGKAEISQFLVKEDLSFGLSDSLALILMAQYDNTKVKFKDWSDNNATADGLYDNETSSSGVNLFGIGLQNRFVDNDKWIAMFSGFFQHQKDTANTFIFDVKAGYKINRTTIYGLARFGYSNLTDGDIYGAFVDDASGDWLMLSYKKDVKDVFYVEGGMGTFSALNKYLYLGGELIYGYYDWHNQLNIKGTLGLQPGDSFALSLYASTSLYDSAKNKVRQYMNYDVNPAPVGTITNSNLVYTTGDYKIKSYNEWKIGLQAILYF